MANDVLDKGPLGNYPYWPRDAQGVPLPYAAVGFGITRVRLPRPTPMGEWYAVSDNRPRNPDGSLLVIPTIPPSG